MRLSCIDGDVASDPVSVWASIGNVKDHSTGLHDFIRKYMEDDEAYLIETQIVQFDAQIDEYNGQKKCKGIPLSMMNYHENC